MELIRRKEKKFFTHSKDVRKENIEKNRIMVRGRNKGLELEDNFISLGDQQF